MNASRNVYDEDEDGKNLQMPPMREHLDAASTGSTEAVPELPSIEMGHAVAVEPQASDSKTGCVYFIETHDGAFVKIGFSVNVSQRFGQIDLLLPGLRLIGHMPGSRSTESQLHRKFAALRENGEWFKYAEDLRLFVSLLQLIAPVMESAPEPEPPPIVTPIPKEMICDCLRCGHSWVKRIAGRPAHCPKCKQPNWDVPTGKLKIGRPLKKTGGKKRKGEKAGAKKGKKAG